VHERENRGVVPRFGQGAAPAVQRWSCTQSGRFAAPRSPFVGAPSGAAMAMALAIAGAGRMDERVDEQMDAGWGSLDGLC
jgi:hypothetical protein